jgi:hypothetical protein
METYTYDITIPFTYDVDRPTISSYAAIDFSANNSGTRINSIGIIETPNAEETEIVLTITIQYEI